MDPAAQDWTSVEGVTLALDPTPVGSQPSEYVINSWKDRPYGATGALLAAAAHNGEDFFVRLRWDDATKDDGIRDTDGFPDAAAVLFAVRGDAPLQSMGSPDQPVNAWYWRPDVESPVSVTATGLGTTVRHGNGSLRATASYEADGWRVVISRPMVVKQEGMVQLRSGWQRKIGFAVWQGSNRERAGIKAVTLEWETLEIEA